MPSHTVDMVLGDKQTNTSGVFMVMKCFVLQRGSIALILCLDRLSDSCLNASVLTPGSSQASFSFEVYFPNVPEHENILDHAMSPEKVGGNSAPSFANL